MTASLLTETAALIVMCGLALFVGATLHALLMGAMRRRERKRPLRDDRLDAAQGRVDALLTAMHFDVDTHALEPRSKA